MDTRSDLTDVQSLITQEIPRLRRYARALLRDAVDADDLVQDSLVRALTKAHLWERGTDLRAWLFTIMHNQHVNSVRSGVRRGSQIPVDDLDLPAMPQSPIATLQLRELDRAMDKLPSEQRAVLLLIGLEGMRYEEVSAVLQIPVGTVRSRVSRGRDMLRKLLDAPERRPAPTARPDETRSASGLSNAA